MTKSASARSKRFLTLGAFVLSVLAVAGGVRLLAGKPVRTEPAAPVRAVRIDDPSTFWQGHGFVEMTAPVRPPTSEDLEVHIVVYLALPDGAVVTTRSAPGQKTSLEYPPGTVSDRVEYFARAGIDDAPGPGWFAADVRGTVLASAGEEFHVYRPTGSGSSASLAGIAWPRGQEEAQKEATRALGALVEDGFVLGPASAAERAKAANRLRSINDCAGCHTRNRPPRERADAAGDVNRGTDGSGFFQLSTVMDDRAPLETYRPRNANAGDPFLRFVCGPAETAAVLEPGVRCPGGEIPVGVLDVPAGARAHDAHALRVCASRRFLYGRLDDAGREVFKGAMQACDGG